MITKDIERLSTLTNKDAISTFTDFMDYCLWAFGVKLEHWPYTKEVSAEFYKAFCKLILDYKNGIDHNGWCDPLGNTFMELIKGIAKYRGQFFTPEGICTLMTDITVDPKAEMSKPKRLCGVYGYRTIINDPTCGSGRNLLAAKSKYARYSEEAQPYFIGEDIDCLCVKMTAINMCVHGCYGEAICHDTLTEVNKVRFGYIINIGIRYGQLPSIQYSDNPLMFESTSMSIDTPVKRFPTKETEKKPAAPTKAPMTDNKPVAKTMKKQKRSEPQQLSLF